jgi:hypothetical protein
MHIIKDQRLPTKSASDLKKIQGITLSIFQTHHNALDFLNECRPAPVDWCVGEPGETE